MSGPPGQAKAVGRRFAATVSLASLAAAVLYVTLSALQRWQVLIASLLTLALIVVAAWYIVSRRGTIRVVAAIAALLAVSAFVLVAVRSESMRVLLLTLALAAVSAASAGYALRSGRAEKPAPSAPSARQPVLLMNPISGGGKVARFDLAARCRRLGVEPIVLGPTDDLLTLAEDAVARGADLLGMAGGDGSQALVASVASRAGIPFVVVPAGTRNHFALDLGIDRDDVPAALEAYRDGVDTVVDLGEVNGRTFVNNAAMGVYAKVIQSTDYRDAKLQTAAAILPRLLGPEASAPALLFTLPSGEESTAGQLLLISNNPYRLGRLRGGTTRERLDRGVLGAASLTVASPADLERLAALELGGQLSRYEGWREWTSSRMEVRSSDLIEVGVDGEALVLEPPLSFVSRPGALTVRLPRAAANARDAIRLTQRSTVAALWRTALGRRGGAE